MIVKFVSISLAVLVLAGCSGAEEQSELVVTNADCREGAWVGAFGETWLLAEPAPNEWHGEFPIAGTVRSGFGARATFISDGFELDLVQRGGGLAKQDSCTMWDAPHPG